MLSKKTTGENHKKKNVEKLDNSFEKPEIYKITPEEYRNIKGDFNDENTISTDIESVYKLSIILLRIISKSINDE